MIDAHLSSCASCRAIAGALAEACELGVKVDDLRLRIERAAQAVAELERQPPHRMHAAIGAAEWGGDRFVAGRLLERSREEFARDPRRSMELARAAITVGERAGSVELQFEAWRDCVSIAVRLGSYAEAWDAVERAMAVAEQTRDREYARALVLYARAYVASQPDVSQFDAAMQWTEEAARIFARTDAARLRAAEEMRAHLHYCRGEHGTSVEMCERLWNARRDIGLALNFSAYLIENAETDRADEILSWARSRISSADRVTLARCAFIEGRLRAAQGRWDAAADAFERATSVFRAVGMDDTAIRTELGRIRATINAAPDALRTIDEAIRALRLVVAVSADLDRREPTRRRRFTTEALEYLRSVADANALTSDLVAHVETYLERMARGPARPYIRPIPPLVM